MACASLAHDLASALIGCRRVANLLGLLLIRMAYAFACPCSCLCPHWVSARRKPSGFAPDSHGLRIRLPCGFAFRAARPFGCILPDASGLMRAAPSPRFPSLSLRFPASGVRCHTLTTAQLRKSLFVFFNLFVSVLKSSPRPISIVKLHALPHFHRRPIPW